MKILVITENDRYAQTVYDTLEPYGHEILDGTIQNGDTIPQLADQNFDVLFLDDDLTPDPKTVFLNARRQHSGTLYCALLARDDIDEHDQISSVNMVINKPVMAEKIQSAAQNAQALLSLIKRIGDDSEDFPSAGGVIAKSAFNQLFLSAIDRADRYGEHSYILFISFNNYQEIYELAGPYGAEYTTAKLSQNLVKLRRQSDIIGQTARNEYALLLQRPAYPEEPMEAAKRFHTEISRLEGMNSGTLSAKIKVNLVQIPGGHSQFNKIIDLS